MKTNGNEPGRVIGLDAHPDSFTAAILCGPTPAAAIVEKMFDHVPFDQLAKWAQKNARPDDEIVLEASGNSFQVVRELAKVGREAKVLESCHLGKLKEGHANNDKLSALRIGKAYLAGTAKEVWVPDLRTQERRDWYHAYHKTVKHSRRVRCSLRSYLSDNGVRLKAHTRLTHPGQAEQQIRSARDWTDRQWRAIEGKLLELRHAEEQREHWHRLIAQEVLDDPELLALVRLCGVREITAFALGAFIGDIHRFASSKKLVKYVGFNPAFDDSGETAWSGGIGGHGHRILRSLLVEGSQAILRSASQPLAQWGKKLLARKGAKNLVVCALARKLTVAVWYLMMGRWTTVEEIDTALSLKVGRLVRFSGPADQKLSRQPRKLLRQRAFALLKAGKTYVLKKSDWKFCPKPAGQATTGLTQEYGLSRV